MRQVTHALLTRPPLSHQKDHSEEINFRCFVRLACVKHAASVHPEPGSNSHVHILTEWQLAVIFPFFTVLVKPFDLFVLKFSLNFRDCFIVQLSMSLLLFLMCNFLSLTHSKLFVNNFLSCFFISFRSRESFVIISWFSTCVNSFFNFFNYIIQGQIDTKSNVYIRFCVYGDR